MKNKDLLALIGLYLVIDGLGSIYYYHAQPLFPDHAFRLIRAVIGLYMLYNISGYYK